MQGTYTAYCDIGDHEAEIEVDWELSGRYMRETRTSPEEWPTLEITECRIDGTEFPVDWVVKEWYETGPQPVTFDEVGRHATETANDRCYDDYHEAREGADR